MSAATPRAGPQPPTAHGCWDEAAAASLPAGAYSWHRCGRRGYCALVAGVEIASVARVRPAGWSLRLAGFSWNATPAGFAALPSEPGQSWFPTSRRAMAVAGELLAAPPFCRNERPAPADVAAPAAAPPAQASFGF